MATLEEITEKVRRAASDELGRTLKLDLKGEGVIHIDGASVSNEDKPADLVVTVSKDDLEKLGRRELDPTRAMMTGRLKLSDMALAMQLRPALQSLFSKAV